MGGDVRFETALVSVPVFVTVKIAVQLLLATIGPHLLMTLVTGKAGVGLMLTINPFQVLTAVAVLPHGLGPFQIIQAM